MLQGAGISDCVTNRGAVELADIMRPTSVDGVRIVTAGTRLDYPASLTSRLAPLLADARQNADVVFVDPPLAGGQRRLRHLPLADAVVIVVHAGRLTENAAHRVAELLGRFRVRVAGALLIGGHACKADYGSGYGYGYGDASARGKGRLRHPGQLAHPSGHADQPEETRRAPR